MNMMIALILIALIATIVSLFAGNISMALGGKYDASHSEGFMQSRLIFQGITLFLIIIAALVW